MKPQESNYRLTSHVSGKSLLTIGITALVVRVTVMGLLQSWNFQDEWTFGYEMGLIGQWLEQGQGFTLDGETPTAKFPPLYPLVVAAFFSVFGAYSKGAAIGLLVFQSVCSAVSAVALAVLGNRLVGRPAGLIAGFVWAFYPTSIFFSVVRIWYSEIAVMLLLITITIIIVTADCSPTPGLVILLGGLSGIIVLTDSTMTLYLPLLFLWMLFSRGLQVSKSIMLLALWLVSAGLVVGPWAARNAIVLGSPLVVKSNLGLELFTGNNSFSSGTNDPAERTRAFSALNQEELEYYQTRSEVVYNRYLRQNALEWIRAHPLMFLDLTVRRVLMFWVMIPGKVWLHLSYYGPFVILALWGLWHGLRRRWLLGPIWLFLLIYPLPYYLTHVARGRFRYPIEPLIVLLAAVPLTIWAVPALCRLLRRQGLFQSHSYSKHA